MVKCTKSNLILINRLYREGKPNYGFVLDEGDRIKEVKLKCGGIVDGIGFGVIDASGNKKELLFYGKGGNLSVLKLEDDEYITQISGEYGNYWPDDDQSTLVLMRIHTNLHPEGHEPYGKSDQSVNTKLFSTPIPLDGCIVGFFGIVGKFLGSIGLYTRKQPVVQKYGPYGHEGEPNFKLMLDQGSRITHVKIKHGEVVDAIGFDILTANGSKTGDLYGGPGGRLSVITLEDGEYITQISGEYGNYKYEPDQISIVLIRIHTNLRPEGHGPYGCGKADMSENIKPFSTPVPLGGSIVGFDGKAHVYLGSIGIYVSKE